MTRIDRLALAAALGLSIVALALQVGSDRVPRATGPEASGSWDALDDAGSSRASLAARLDRLERALERETAARHTLEGSLATLLEERRGPGSDDARATAERDDAWAGRQRRTAGPPGLDESVLVAEAGLAPSEARSLREAYDALQMEQLYLRDRAAREGWSSDPGLREELEALVEQERALFRDFGEEAEDWLLYATGRPNRVRVSEVFRSSPAAAAGLSVGDTIVRYGDQPIRSGTDLQQATIAGEPGEWVDVEIARDGRRERLRLPRGPVGVRLEVVSERPGGAPR